MLSEHLGDGAYISETDVGFILTANHHDPNKATDTVHVDAQSMRQLIRFIKRSRFSNWLKDE